MRWLYMIVSFLMKRATAGGGEKRHPMEEFKEFLKENALKLFVGMVLTVALGTMLTSGIYMATASLSAQVDLGLVPRMTMMVWTGTIMALVPIIILSFAWYRSGPHEVKPRKRKHAAQQPASLEQAMVLLITDFIKEREMKREFKFERERRMAEAEMNAESFRTSAENFERH